MMVSNIKLRGVNQLLMETKGVLHFPAPDPEKYIQITTTTKKNTKTKPGPINLVSGISAVDVRVMFFTDDAAVFFWQHTGILLDEARKDF